MIAGAVLMGLGWVGAAGADTLETTDGRKLTVRVIVQSDTHTMVEIYNEDGTKRRQTFPADQIKSITPGPLPDKPAEAKAESAAASTRPIPPEPPPVVAYDQPTFYRIPLSGTVGQEFNASLLETAINDAMTRNPSVVILEINSPGGLISEVPKLTRLIDDHRRKVPIVVWVHEAVSAAAITALAADQIYVKPGGVIGAATAFAIDPKSGMPRDIEEKLASVWRATSRSAAELGGHSTLIAEAMIDANVAIYISTDGTQRLTSIPQTGFHPLKPAGKLLTMTAQEAVDIGLARGTARDLDELGKRLGHDAWVECVGIGEAQAQYQTKHTEWVKSEWEAIGKRIRDHLAKAEANDPSTFSDYRVWANNGEMVGESRTKWQGRAARTNAALVAAEKEIGLAVDFARQHPDLLPDADQIEEFKEHIARVRARVANANKR
jgi:membrane-bound serine protease (ClpP class)